MQYRRILGKPYIPLYLFFPPLSEQGKAFQIAQVLPDGDTKEIFSGEFPSYDALVAGDKTSTKATRTATFKATVDTFQLTCICLSIVVTVLLILDVANILKLSTKQLGLAGLAAVLLVLPFAAKLKMLGIEFERHNPTKSND